MNQRSDHTPWQPNRCQLRDRTKEMEPRIFQGLDGDCEMSFSTRDWTPARLARAVQITDSIILTLTATEYPGTISHKSQPPAKQ